MVRCLMEVAPGDGVHNAVRLNLCLFVAHPGRRNTLRKIDKL